MKISPYLLLASTLFTTISASAAPFVVYVTSGMGNDNDNAGTYQCSIDATSGQLSSCIQTSYKGIADSVTNYSYTTASTGNQVLAFAYLADEQKGITLCSIIPPGLPIKKPAGSFDECTVTPTSGAPANWRPSGLAIPETPDNYPMQYAYVADFSGHVYQCSIPYNDMKLTTCVVAAAKEPWNNPNKVITKKIGGAQYAYVAANEGVFQCSLKQDFSFGECKSVVTDKAPKWSATDVTFATVNNAQIAYVASYSMFPGMGNPGLYRCNVADDGTFNKCASVTGNPAQDGNTREVAIFQGKTQQFALVSDSVNVYSCAISPDGNFSACAATPAKQPVWYPFGISILDFGTQTNKVQK